MGGVDTHTHPNSSPFPPLPIAAAAAAAAQRLCFHKAKLKVDFSVEGLPPASCSGHHCSSDSPLVNSWEDFPEGPAALPQVASALYLFMEGTGRSPPGQMFSLEPASATKGHLQTPQTCPSSIQGLGSLLPFFSSEPTTEPGRGKSPPPHPDTLPVPGRPRPTEVPPAVTDAPCQQISSENAGRPRGAGP